MKVNLSIVTVIYNHSQETIDTYFENILDKIQYNERIFNYNIYIIDNSDNNIQLKLPTESIIHYIKSNVNTGYCGGNNIGCEQANDGYIIICNPDITINDSLTIDWLYSLALQHNSISGIYRDGKSWLTYPAMFPTDVKYSEDNLPFVYSTNPNTISPEKKWKSLPFIDGSLMCFSKSLWNAVRFDTNFFPGYFGENAFQYKAKQLGYSLKHCPIEKMIKHNSQSDNQYSQANKMKWTEDSRKYFYKHYALSDYEYFINQLV